MFSGATMSIDSKKSGSTWAVVAIFAIVLPVLYVLSSGPVWLLCMHSVISPESYDAIYFPLDWICHDLIGPPLSDIYVDYVLLWQTNLAFA